MKTPIIYVVDYSQIVGKCVVVNVVTGERQSAWKERGDAERVASDLNRNQTHKGLPASAHTDGE